MICPEDLQPCTLDHSEACYQTCLSYLRRAAARRIVAEREVAREVPAQ